MKRYSFLLHGAADSSPGGLSQLKAKIGAAFKLSDAAVNSLFKNLPVTLKKGLEEHQVENYKRVFAQMGALVEIVEEGGPAAPQGEMKLAIEDPIQTAPIPTEPKEAEAPAMRAEPKSPPPPPPPPISTPESIATDVVPDTEPEAEIEAEPADISVLGFSLSPRALAVISGVLVLLIIAVVALFSGDDSAEKATIDDDTVKKIVTEQTKESNSARVKGAAQPDSVEPPVALTARTNDGISASDITILIQDKKISEIEFTLQSIPPEKLTPDQVVAGVVRKPWIERAELTASAEAITSELPANSPTTNRITFSANASGRAYLRDDQGTGRAISHLRISGSYDPTQAVVTGKWMIADSPENFSASPFAERVAGDKFHFLLQGEFTATRAP